MTDTLRDVLARMMADGVAKQLVNRDGALLEICAEAIAPAVQELIEAIGETRARNNDYAAWMRVDRALQAFEVK